MQLAQRTGLVVTPFIFERSPDQPYHDFMAHASAHVNEQIQSLEDSSTDQRQYGRIKPNWLVDPLTGNVTCMLQYLLIETKVEGGIADGPMGGESDILQAARETSTVHQKV